MTHHSSTVATTGCIGVALERDDRAVASHGFHHADMADPTDEVEEDHRTGTRCVTPPPGPLVVRSKRRRVPRVAHIQDAALLQHVAGAGGTPGLTGGVPMVRVDLAVGLRWVLRRTELLAEEVERLPHSLRRHGQLPSSWRPPPLPNGDPG